MPFMFSVLLVTTALAEPAAPFPLKFAPIDAPHDQWAPRESASLTHIRQLTQPSMGLDKAGEAYFSPDGRAIIFQAYPTGQSAYQMYVLRLDAAGAPLPDSLKRVSPSGGACTCGYFRHDGKRVLFGSTYLQPNAPADSVYHRERSGYRWEMPVGMDIFETDLDGGHSQQLTRTSGYDAEGSYGPGGRQIVFTSCRDGGDPEIWVMNADGSAPRRLTHTPGYDGGPFFSPDGQRIIFRADRHKNDLLQLFVMNADGSHERQLTDTDYVNWGPFWHPTGHTVAFATSAHGHQNYEVYLLNVDTGKLARLTYHDGFDGLPVFSADGKKMMWTSKRGPDGTSQIFAADFTLPPGF
ncbi:MAG: hypothetical protein U1A27_01675 [Phycisphaerae bacterium]